MDARLTRRTTLAGAAASAVALGAGFRPRSLQAQEAPVAGGTLRMVISEEPDFLDPARTILLLSSNLMNHIYDCLVFIGEDRLPHPWLAESWEVSDDGLVVSFTLREGVTFTDGTPVDAAAVKANFDRHLDPKIASPRLANMGTLQTVEAPDATTVVFTFKEPYAPIFTVWAGIFIYSPTAQEELGDEFGRQPVGSGPFMLTEWDTSSRIKFERNPDYVNYRDDDLNKGAAYLDAIEYFIIPEPATQTAAFEGKELDLLSPSREDMATVAAFPGVQVVSLEEAFNLNFLEFGNFAPFNNPLLRKAISYAINREQVIELAYFDNATVNQCPVPRGNAAWAEAFCGEFGTTYDVEAAKAALAEAGWTDEDGDGFVEIDGSAEPIMLSTYGPYPVQARSIELMQGDLQAAGINAEIQVLETTTLISGIEAGDIGMDYMRWTYSDQLILSLLFTSPGWSNQMDDPELDKLIAVANETLDPEARIEASHAVMQRVLEQYYIVPICTDWVQVAVQESVRDYHWDALGGERLIDTWLVQ